MPNITAAAFVRIPFITTIYRYIGNFAQEPQPQLQIGCRYALEGVPMVV
jgi:hypothetical protein